MLVCVIDESGCCNGGGVDGGDVTDDGAVVTTGADCVEEEDATAIGVSVFVYLLIFLYQ